MLLLAYLTWQSAGVGACDVPACASSHDQHYHEIIGTSRCCSHAVAATPLTDVFVGCSRWDHTPYWRRRGPVCWSSGVRPRCRPASWTASAGRPPAPRSCSTAGRGAGTPPARLDPSPPPNTRPAHLSMEIQKTPRRPLSARRSRAQPTASLLAHWQRPMALMQPQCPLRRSLCGSSACCPAGVSRRQLSRRQLLRSCRAARTAPIAATEAP